MKNAFTLIELLVVVLIIGILAATALPMYNKTVERTIMEGAVPMGKAVAQAEERFFMEHGRYTADPEELDIKYECPPKFTCVFNTAYGYFDMQRTSAYGFNFHYNNSTVDPFKGWHYCWAGKTDTKNLALCKSIATGKDTYDGGGWLGYRL